MQDAGPLPRFCGVHSLTRTILNVPAWINLLPPAVARYVQGILISERRIGVPCEIIASLLPNPVAPPPFQVDKQDTSVEVCRYRGKVVRSPLASLRPLGVAHSAEDGASQLDTPQRFQVIKHEKVRI